MQMQTISHLRSHTSRSFSHRIRRFIRSQHRVRLHNKNSPTRVKTSMKTQAVILWKHGFKNC
jgi:hypothetical protein